MFPGGGGGAASVSDIYIYIFHKLSIIGLVQRGRNNFLTTNIELPDLDNILNKLRYVFLETGNNLYRAYIVVWLTNCVLCILSV